MVNNIKNGSCFNCRSQNHYIFFIVPYYNSGTLWEGTCLMTRLLNRLKLRFGRYTIDNLMLVICIGQLIVFFADLLTRGWASDLLWLSWSDVTHGQIWRLVTFIFEPNTRNIGEWMGKFQFQLLLSLRHDLQHSSISFYRIWDKLLSQLDTILCFFNALSGFSAFVFLCYPFKSKMDRIDRWIVLLIWVYSVSWFEAEHAGITGSFHPFLLGWYDQRGKKMALQNEKQINLK